MHLYYMRFKNYIQPYIEGAIRSLDNNFYVVIKERPNNYMIDLVYLDRDNLTPEVCRVIGGIRVYRSSKTAENVWHVTMVRAEKGYGPLLYDLVMETVTKQGGWICRDLASTTNAASNVWDYYYNNRPDVQKTPIPQDASKTKHPIMRDSMHYMYRKPDMAETTRLGKHIIHGPWSQDSLETVAIKLGLMQASAKEDNYD